MLFFTFVGIGFFYVFRDTPNEAIEYFFTSLGIGLSATVLQCYLIQNKFKKII